MASEIENLLLEYERIRRDNKANLENRKSNLFKKIPRLNEIEEEINKLSINKTKSILTNGNIKEIQKIEKNIDCLKDEMHKLLQKEGIDESIFKLKYNCEKCLDTGFIKFNNKKSQMCSCLKQKLINISYNKSNLGNLKNENFENFNLNMFSNNVDLEKYNMNISPRQNIENIKKASLQFVENFENKNTKNLFFTGNTGLGKTYMTNCIANELLKMGKTVLYQTAPVLLETIIDNKFNKYKTSNTYDFYNNVLDVDLLIIDDLGTEVPNSMKISELFTILNARALNLNNKLTRTIISSNLSIEKIFSVYEERIGSRIAGFYDIYYFFGEDLRLKK